MSRYLLTAMILATAVGAGRAPAARKPLQIPKTEEDFETIVRTLKIEAHSFAQADDDEGPTPSKTVALLEYTAASSDALVEVLQADHGEGVEHLYVAYQLCQPLKMSGDEVLRAVRPAVVSLLEDHCKYKSMPHWPATMLHQLRPLAEGLSPGELKAAKKAREQARRKKQAAEWAVVKHNRTAGALADTLKKLLGLMSDKLADELLLRQLNREDARRLATYKVTLAAIRDQAVRMDRERAKACYDRLKAMAMHADGKVKNYLDPARPKYNPAADSRFEYVRGNFVVEALKVVNLMATAAKQPAVKIPGEKTPRQPRQPRPRRR